MDGFMQPQDNGKRVEESTPKGRLSVKSAPAM
jgi:hypothetical protein